MNTYLDTETLPTNDPAIIADIAKTITAPANYTKPESIQKWMDENYEQALKDKIHRTGLDGLYGRICVICIALDDGPVHSFHGNDERLLLVEFMAFMREVTAVPMHQGSTHQDAVFVGHNIAGFDLQFLKHRAIINGIKPPPALLKAMNAKPWDGCIADTMLMWSADREKRVSMGKLCKAFGIAGKGDFDGSMVAETWPVDPQKVIDYCADDVLRTREIYKRITFTNL